MSEALSGVDAAHGVQRAVDRFYVALSHVLSGDPQPMVARWSREADVCVPDHALRGQEPSPHRPSPWKD